jgi:hypothetical protein
MDLDGKIRLGRQIIDRLAREKGFSIFDTVNEQEDYGGEAFKKFDSLTSLGFYNDEENGVFSFGWRLFEEDKAKRDIYRNVLASSEFDQDFSSVKEDGDSPWIWRDYKGDVGQPFDRIYGFFAEKFDLLEKLARSRF